MNFLFIVYSILCRFYSSIALKQGTFYGQKEGAAGNELTDDLLPDFIRAPWTAPSLRETSRKRSALPRSGRQDPPPDIPGRTLAEKMASYEMYLLEETLRRNQGNITRSAKELGIQRQNLQYRIRKYGIEV